MNQDDIRSQIKWFNTNKELIYADTAATSLKPTCLSEAASTYYNEQSSNPHNSDSIFTNNALIKMEECRELVANLVNVGKDEIMFNSGTTEGLNLVAQSLKKFLKKDDEIVLTKYEHASNLLPWYNLRDELGVKIVFVDVKDFKPTVDDFLKHINEKTKIVSFTGTSNLIGLSFDVEQITNAIKNVNPNIFVCVDVAQMIPHKKCDFKNWGVDFGCFSAHKIFGPTGIGAIYIKKSLQESVNPIRFGGGMNFSIDYNNFCYLNGVEKYEGGTPNVAGIYAWTEALKFFNNIGYDLIHKIENQIYEMLWSELKDCKNIEVYNWGCHSPILAFNVKGVFCQDTASYLGKKGIIVRSGLSCAKLMDNVLNVDGLVRASFYVYNTLDEIKKFIQIIKQLDKETILNEII